MHKLPEESAQMDYFVTDQIKAITHPKTVQPKVIFNKNMANMFLCWRNEAMRNGKK